MKVPVPVYVRAEKIWLLKFEKLQYLNAFRIYLDQFAGMVKHRVNSASPLIWAALTVFIFPCGGFLMGQSGYHPIKILRYWIFMHGLLLLRILDTDRKRIPNHAVSFAGGVNPASAVCDGAGGLSKGEVTSRRAVKMLGHGRTMSFHAFWSRIRLGKSCAAVSGSSLWRLIKKFFTAISGAE